MSKSPIKYHGGKTYLANRIIELMPPHTHYVEPYFGGGSVLLQKDPIGVSEVANDIWGELMNFWRVLQDGVSYQHFIRRVEATPFAKPEWEVATRIPVNPPDVPAAVDFFIRCRQSRAGQFREFATVSRNRLRRNMNEQCSAWINCVEGLPDIHTRLMRVVIICEDALSTIQKQDGPNTLFYLDPPYIHETRQCSGMYRFEMAEEDHDSLIDVLKGIQGKVILSGYPNKLYEGRLSDWRIHDIDMPNHAAGGKTKRRMTERLWMNYEPPGTDS